MATRKSSANAARTGSKRAGTPTDASAGGTRAAARADHTPSAADLDLRDRLKAGPRRPAGPPLVGDILTRAAMDALRDEVVPEPTDPKNRRARK
ncbi:MAG: hypothetical protein KGI90_04675 [Burkholderiales bacterium]|nr:hypothetical protein [Burkholderiales bacterium]